VRRLVALPRLTPAGHGIARAGWRAKLVNYKPHDSSIGRLRKKPHPHVRPNTKRIEGVETTNYRVAARLVEMSSGVVEFGRHAFRFGDVEHTDLMMRLDLEA
jgi:hypothetical protein